MAYDSIAVITDEAKRRMGESWVTGKSFKVKYFSISSGGHNPLDPTVALAVDPTQTEMQGAVLLGPAPIDGYEFSSDNCPIILCNVLPGEIIGAVSSLGLWAEVEYVPPGDPEPVGTRFLFAIHNRPLVVFTGSDSAEFRVNLFM
jgi:hypothetical protein